MHLRHALSGLLAGLVLSAGTSCKKSESGSSSGLASPPATAALSADTVARVHWLGKKRLGIEASAYYLMRLWELPESTRLEAQTLGKLSSTLWPLLRGDAVASTDRSAMFRPLLDDLLREESFFEMRGASNQPMELAFAIKLDDQRAGLWRTNTVALLASLTGITTMDLQVDGRGWSLKRQEPPALIELSRVGEWTVVGAARGKNALLGEIIGRIRRDRVPFLAQTTNYWLEADLDLQRTANALGLGSNLPDNTPRISVAVTGDGGNVLTHGKLTFPEPLRIEFEPWAVPSNLLHEPLAGFTAIRGVRPWVASWKTWIDLQLGTPPNQLYFWALQGAPVQTYFAAPLSDSTNQVRKLTDLLVEKSNPWLASHGYVNFERSPDSNGATWGKLPNILPFIKSVGAGENALVLGGLLPDAAAGTNRPARAELLREVLARTNLVYYDWENTGQRIEACLYLGQIVRTVLRRAPLPLESASAAWLKALNLRLVDCTTVIASSGTNQLSFVRKSTAGFTGVELQLLADWLESPQFPRGLHSFLAPPAAPPQR